MRLKISSLYKTAHTTKTHKIDFLFMDPYKIIVLWKSGANFMGCWAIKDEEENARLAMDNIFYKSK